MSSEKHLMRSVLLWVLAFVAAATAGCYSFQQPNGGTASPEQARVERIKIPAIWKPVKCNG